MPRDAYRKDAKPNFQVPPYPNREIFGHTQPAQIGQNQSSPAMGRLEQPARVMSDFGSIDVRSIQGIAANKVNVQRLFALPSTPKEYFLLRKLVRR